MDGPHGESTVLSMPQHSWDKRPPLSQGWGIGPHAPAAPSANAWHHRLRTTVPDPSCQ